MLVIDMSIRTHALFAACVDNIFRSRCQPATVKQRHILGAKPERHFVLSLTSLARTKTYYTTAITLFNRSQKNAIEWRKCKAMYTNAIQGRNRII